MSKEKCYEVINVLSILNGGYDIRSFIYDCNNEEEKQKVFKQCDEFFLKQINTYLPELNFTIKDCEEINFMFENHEEYQFFQIFSKMKDGERFDLTT